MVPNERTTLPCPAASGVTTQQRVPSAPDQDSPRFAELQPFRQFRLTFGENFLVQRIAVRVHRDDGREILHFK